MKGDGIRYLITIRDYFPDYLLYFIFFTSHIYFPSTITVDSVNHTYTGTLSSSTYSGYKLAANSNKVVSAGDHTLSGYTGNNITLAISGNSVSVKNTKTSTNRTTELQNFIKSNWSVEFTYLYRLQDYDDYVYHEIYTDISRSPITKPTINVNLIYLITGAKYNTPYFVDDYGTSIIVKWGYNGKIYYFHFKHQNNYTLIT